MRVPPWLAHGLLDTALPLEDLAIVEGVQERHREQDGVRFHALRTRSAGARRFVSMHVLVPGTWTVSRGHDLSERLEREIVEELPMTTVFVHLEPLEDEASFRDQGLDRPGSGTEDRDTRTCENVHLPRIPVNEVLARRDAGGMCPASASRH